MSLPTDPKARKAVPIATGCIDYFPDALAAVADVSRIGNEQHHPGTPLHWDRSKSSDEADALLRHFVERGSIDTDGVRHSAKVAWRALALLQKEIEADTAKDDDFVKVRLTDDPLLCAESGCSNLATASYYTLDSMAGEYKERWLCDTHGGWN